MQRITEETFRILVNAGSVRKITFQPAPWNGKERWAVVLKLGMEEATIKSARTGVRTWTSLDSLARWLKAQGCGVAEHAGGVGAWPHRVHGRKKAKDGMAAAGVEV
ncbi:MAG: hypothetical protein ACYDD9_14360 [Acidithiobacillus sp.]